MSTDWVAVAGVIGGCAFVIVVVWQVFATGRTAIKSNKDKAYKKLAEEAAASQKETAEALADLRVRVASIEKLMREVE